MKKAKCNVCGEDMPTGEEMFNYHGLSGPCPKPLKKATDNPELEFKPLTSEEWREYTFPNGSVVKIDRPQALNVSKSGGHRIQAENGNGIYIPAGWVKLEWKNKDSVESSIQF